MQVEIWADVVCPWCYLGTRHFEQVLERFPHRDQVEVIYRSYGVSGAPFVVIDRRYGISGAQPPETIAAVLERVWAETAAA